jgi:hypothetical protein
MSNDPTKPPPITKEQIAAYTATNYEVALPGGAIAVIRIGQPLPEALQSELGAGHSVSVVTAWNPFSTNLNEEVNKARNATLTSDLVERGLRFLPARGVGTDLSWEPEESFAVFDADRPTLDALLVDHAQNAVVHVPSGGLAELVFHPHAPRAPAT